MAFNFDKLPDDAKRAAFANMKPGKGKRPVGNDSDIDAKMQRLIKACAKKGIPLHQGEIRAIRQHLERQRNVQALSRFLEEIWEETAEQAAREEKARVFRERGPEAPRNYLQKIDELANSITRVLLKIKPNISISIEDQSDKLPSPARLRASRPGHIYGKAFLDEVPPKGTPGFWEGRHPTDNPALTMSDPDRSHPYYGRYFVETAPPALNAGWEIPLGCGKKIVVKNPHIELGTDIDLNRTIEWILNQLWKPDGRKSR